MRDDSGPLIERTQLSRDLGEFDITMIGVGAMIGAGIFVLTGIAAGAAGPALVLAFALNGVVTIFTAMVYAELGSAIPEAGGGYLWVKDALGHSNGFVAGWMSWFSHAVAGSLYSIGFGSYTAMIFEELGYGSILGLSGEPLEKLLGVGVALLFLWINFLGASHAGLVGNVVTLGKLAIIGMFIVSGLVAMAGKSQPAADFQPFFPNGYGSVFVAMGLTFIAFEGYEIIVQAGEEVRNPRRTIPRAVFWSLLIVVPIYVLVAITAIGAVDAEGAPTWQFLGEHKERGLVEAARQFMPFGTMLLLLGGLLSTTSALNATTYSSTRVAFAMGRDRVLPGAFARVHRRTRTPWVALLASGAIIIFMVLAIPIEDVAAAADVMFLLLFLQVNWAVIKIREEYGDRLRYGYLMPLYPWVPLAGIVTKAFLAVWLYTYSPTAWYAAGAWVLVGLGVFVAYSHQRVEEMERPRVAYEEHERRVRRSPVIVYAATAEHVEVELRIGAALARARDVDLVALTVVRVPRQLPLKEGLKFVDEAEPILDRVLAFERASGSDLDAVVTVGHRLSHAVVRMAEEQDATTVVLGWKGAVKRSLVRGSAEEAVLQEADTEVVVIQGDALPDDIEAIGIGVSPGVRWFGALGVAVSLAKAMDARLRLVTFARAGADAGELREWFDEVMDYCFENGLPSARLDAEIRESGRPLEGLVEEAEAVDVFVVGASRDWALRSRLVGSLPDTLANRTETTLVMVKEPEARWKSGWRRLIALVHGVR